MEELLVVVGFGNMIVLMNSSGGRGVSRSSKLECSHERRHHLREVRMLRPGLLVEFNLGRRAWLDKKLARGIRQDTIVTCGGVLERPKRGGV